MTRTSQTSSNSPTRPVWLLALGAATGLLLATFGLLRGATDSMSGLPDAVVARVNESSLLVADFERLVAGLESDTRSVASAATRKRVLDRMIDEELLVQRGLELGLATRDRKVRGDLSSAVIRSVVVEAEQRVASPDELARFFADEMAFFTQPGRLRVKQIFFRVRTTDDDTAAATRAAEALALLKAGEDFQTVRDLGDPVISQIPDVLLPQTKLREYIGPAALRATLELDVGLPSEPVRTGAGYHILVVTDREAAKTPSLDQFEPQVRAEWRRRTGDEALRSYLDELRNRADLVVRAVNADPL